MTENYTQECEKFEALGRQKQPACRPVGYNQQSTSNVEGFKAVGPTGGGDVMLSDILTIERTEGPLHPGNLPVEFAIHHAALSKESQLKRRVKCKQHGDPSTEWKDLLQAFPGATIEEKPTSVVIKIPRGHFSCKTSFAVIATTASPSLCAENSSGECGTPVDSLEYQYEGDKIALSPVHEFSRDPEKDSGEERKLKIDHSAVVDKTGHWEVSVLAYDPQSKIWEDITDVCPSAKCTVSPSDAVMEIPNGSIGSDTKLVVVGVPREGAKKRSPAYAFLECKGSNPFNIEIYSGGVPATKADSAVLPCQLEFPVNGPHDIKLMGVKTMEESITWEFDPIIEEVGPHEAATDIPQRIALDIYVNPEPTGSRTMVKLMLELACGGTTMFLPLILDTKSKGLRTTQE